MQISLFAVVNPNGTIALYPTEPRYEKSIPGFVCSYGEIILKKNLKYKDLVEYVLKHSSEEKAVMVVADIDLTEIDLTEVGQ